MRPNGWQAEAAFRLRQRPETARKPKTAARLIRFDRVWRHVDRRRPLDWGQVAADTGYADQAHLIRDFRQFTGITPTGYQAVMATQGCPGH